MPVRKISVDFLDRFLPARRLLSSWTFKDLSVSVVCPLTGLAFSPVP